MDEQTLCASAQTTQNTSSPSTGGWWADLRCLAILVLLVVAVRAWQITHTEVASRDSISYIRIAWHLEHDSWREVMPQSPQHPGYPLAVLAMSLPVRHFIPNDLPWAWQLSAQLTSAMASLLLLVPMFYLGRELFDRRVAFWACVLFQCLPTSGKVMGDGLSDTLFLLFACAGLWLACVALRRGSWIIFALTGLASGLAYLTRPEGALIVGATGLVLLGIQMSRRWRRSWSSILVHGGALSLAALAVMLPYMLLIGGITVKNTPNIMMHSERKDADWEGRLRPQPAKKGELQSRGTTPGSPLLAIWWTPSDMSRYLWALKALATELGKGFFFVAWMPALLGLWWFRNRFFRMPGAWVLLLVCLSLVTLLYRVAEKMGYLSDRHLLVIILCGCYWAVAGTIVLGEKLALGATRLRPALAGRRWIDGRAWSMGLLLLLTMAPLPRTLQSLHAERAGFRPVGQWLAKNTEAGDFIEDPYCWTYYWAGRVFVEGNTGLRASKPPCFYVVVEESKNEHAHLVSLRRALFHILRQKGSTIVHEQVVQRGKEKVKILVWHVPGPYGYTPLPALVGQN